MVERLEGRAGGSRFARPLARSPARPLGLPSYSAMSRIEMPNKSCVTSTSSFDCARASSAVSASSVCHVVYLGERERG